MTIPTTRKQGLFSKLIHGKHESPESLEEDVHYRTLDQYLCDLGQSFNHLNNNVLSVGIEAHKTSEFIEHELRTVKHRFFTVIDNMVDIVIIKDPEGRWITANKFTQDLFGLEIPDYYLKKTTEIKMCDENNVDEFEKSLESEQEAWQTRTSVRDTRCYVDSKGNKRLFDVIKTPTFDEDTSKPQEMIVVGRDITDLHKTQQMNKAAIEALNNSSDSVLILDKDANITFCNPQFLDVFGYDCLEDVFNQPINIINSSIHSDAFFKEMWDTLNNNLPWEGTVFNRRKDNKVIQVYAHMVPIRNGGPVPIFFIVVMKTMGHTP